MADYTSAHTGAVVDAAITKSAKLPATTTGDGGKSVKVNDEGTAYEHVNEYSNSEIDIAIASSGFPSATSMVFYQALAPTGWTKKSNWAANTAMVVGNTYATPTGTDSPTSWTTALVSASHALTEAELATHDHAVGTLATASDSHTHSCLRTGSTWYGGDYGQNTGAHTGGTTNSDTHTHNITGSVANAGSGHAHSHTLTQDTYTPIYAVMIVATRDA